MPPPCLSAAPRLRGVYAVLLVEEGVDRDVRDHVELEVGEARVEELRQDHLEIVKCRKRALAQPLRDAARNAAPRQVELQPALVLDQPRNEFHATARVRIERADEGFYVSFVTSHDGATGDARRRSPVS